MKTIHIEKKRRDATLSAGAIRDALLVEEGLAELTPADASTLSGVPLDDAEPALISLAHTYPSRIRVTEAGDLLFHFDSLHDQRRPVRGPIWRAFAALGGWFSRHRLTFYALFTLLLLPPLMLAAAFNLAALGAVLPEGIIAVVVGLPLFCVGGLLFCAGALGVIFLQVFPILAVVSILTGVAVMFAPIFAADIRLWMLVIFIPLGALGAAGGLWMWAFAREAYKATAAGTSAKWARDMWVAFGGYAFGPSEPKVGDLADERSLTMLIARCQGVISVWDLVELFGWTEEVADRELTRIMVDYGGDVVVTDDGELLYVFEALLRSSPDSGGQVPGGQRPSSVAEARLGKRPPLFGCSDGIAWFISVLAIVPLLGVLLHPDLVLVPSIEHYEWLAAQNTELPIFLGEGFGVIPYLIVLAGPILRLPFWLRSVRKWRQARSALDRRGEEAHSDEARRARAAGEALRRQLAAHDPALGAIVFDTDATGRR